MSHLVRSSKAVKFAQYHRDRGPKQSGRVAAILTEFEKMSVSSPCPDQSDQSSKLVDVTDCRGTLIQQSNLRGDVVIQTLLRVLRLCAVREGEDYRIGLVTNPTEVNDHSAPLPIRSRKEDIVLLKVVKDVVVVVHEPDRPHDVVSDGEPILWGEDWATGEQDFAKGHSLTGISVANKLHHQTYLPHRHLDAPVVRREEPLATWNEK